MNAALTEIRFYGHLRPVFGKSIRLSVGSPAEAIRALCAVLPGFGKYVSEHSAPGYRVVVGNSAIMADREIVSPSGRQTIKLVPAVAGRGGLGKIIAGAALIAFSFYTGGAGMAVTKAFAEGGLLMAAGSIAFSLGVSMALGGVAQMLAGTPAAPTPAERANNQPSYTFNGAVNTSAQGNPVPICYGRMRVGSQVISTGLEAASL